MVEGAVPIVVMSPPGTPRALARLGLGSATVFEKPVDVDDLRISVWGLARLGWAPRT